MAEQFVTYKTLVRVRGEDGEWLKDEKGHYIKVEKETKYRVDIDFIPKKIDEICIEFIDNYVTAHNEGEWFSEVLSMDEEIKKGTRKGQKQKASFVTIRSKFVNKFFPNIIIGKPNEGSKMDDLRKRYGVK